MPLIVLLLISSDFVPADAMPGCVQPIAEYQPFVLAIETLRGLLPGSEIGSNGWLAVTWSLVLSMLGYFWPNPGRSGFQPRSEVAETTRAGASRNASRPRAAYSDTASDYAAPSAYSAALRAQGRGHRRLELAPHPDPFGQRDQPYTMAKAPDAYAQASPPSVCPKTRPSPLRPR